MLHFSEKILQTPLHQLPYSVSQINSSVHKLQHDIVKYLEENINVCMDNYSKKKQLRAQIIESNEKYKELEMIGKQLQTLFVIKSKPVQQKQIKDNEQKLFEAIRNQNQEEIIKILSEIQDLQKLFEYSKIIVGLLHTPNKQNKPKIIVLFQFLSKLVLDITQRNSIMEIAAKVLIQKCFKMYFEQKIFNTNRNQQTYYSDIIQLYQKSFNCTFKLLQHFETKDYYQSYIANQIFDRFQQNFLQQLLSTFQKERTISVIMTFRDIQQNNLLYQITQNYCQNIYSKEFINETKQKSILIYLRAAINRNDKSIYNYLVNNDTEKLKSEMKNNKLIQYNYQILQELFKECNIECILKK